ncbi:hypothetical protein [Arthrobacter sp. VKM Ac-2550]|uniref:hypothetical protein n=1 Tax=Crystallibacter permensis TaxID=1938888 RepID=UPI002225DFC8|nr:hypothetical protein [Arthrobacter sp. VKM Ac-2550]MCW2132875.1 hypothetical protein [Arthrobacter sp. VKM Ac-2550]
MLPTNVSTGTVAGRFLIASGDGVDDGLDPDGGPASGRVLFTPAVPYLQNPDAADGPVTVLPEPVIGLLDKDGYLCTPMPRRPGRAGERGVRLIATDDVDMLTTDWTWTATFDLSVGKNRIPAASFHLPADATVDLTTVVSIPTNKGYGLPQAEAAAGVAKTAAVDAAQSAADAEAAAVQTVTTGAVVGDDLVLTKYNGETVVAGNVRGQQGEPGPNTVPTQDAVAGYIETPGNPVNTALSATTASAIKAADKRVSSAQAMGQTQQANTGKMIIGVFPEAVIAVNQYGLSQNENTQLNPLNWVAKNLPADAQTDIASMGHVSMVKFQGIYYMQIMRTDGLPMIVRASPKAGTAQFEWSAPLLIGEAGSNIISTALACDDQYIYWGDYGDTVAGPSVYRSINGAHWDRVLGPGGFTGRHVHAIEVDPYNPGHVWMTTGDANSAGYVYYSTDYGLTWQKPAFGANQAWQAVQISFDEDWIYFASDSTVHLVVYKIDRETHTPRWHGKNSHRYMPVPGGLPSRRITDLTTTQGSNKITSATANFTALDVGTRIRTEGQDIVPIDTYIQSVQDATTAFVYSSKAATLTTTTGRAVIGGEHWGVMPYYGAIDPVNGVYYFVAFNGSSGGNVNGLFAVLPDGSVILLDFLPAYPDARVYVSNDRGRVFVYGFWRPLLVM